MFTRVMLLVLSASIAAACSSSGGDGLDDGRTGDSDDQSPGGPGDFTSVWQARTIDILIIDQQNPLGSVKATHDVPRTMLDANIGLEVESYITFDASLLVLYAHYEGQDYYYRITEPGTATPEVFIASHSQYLLQDGALAQTSTAQNGSQSLVMTTHFSVAQFPPSTWPSRVVDYDAAELQ